MVAMPQSEFLPNCVGRITWRAVDSALACSSAELMFGAACPRARHSAMLFNKDLSRFS